MRHSRRGFGNRSTQQIAKQRGDPRQRLVDRKEGDPLRLPGDLGQHRCPEYLQDGQCQGEAAGCQHGEEAHARKGQDQRGHHRQRPAADQEHAIADPVRQGRKGEADAKQRECGERIEDADDRIGKTEGAHVEVENEVEDAGGDRDQQGEGEELSSSGTQRCKARQRSAEGCSGSHQPSRLGPGRLPRGTCRRWLGRRLDRLIDLAPNGGLDHQRVVAAVVEPVTDFKR